MGQRIATESLDGFENLLFSDFFKAYGKRSGQRRQMC